MRYWILLAAAAFMASQAQAEQPTVEHMNYRTIEIAGQKFALVDTVINDGGKRVACSQYVAKFDKEETSGGSKLNVQIEHTCTDQPKSLAMK